MYLDNRSEHVFSSRYHTHFKLHKGTGYNSEQKLNQVEIRLARLNFSQVTTAL